MDVAASVAGDRLYRPSPLPQGAGIELEPAGRCRETDFRFSVNLYPDHSPLAGYRRPFEQHDLRTGGKRLGRGDDPALGIDLRAIQLLGRQTSLVAAVNLLVDR